MTFIQIEDLTKIVGAKTLFENISFSIDRGSKVALVAKNGTGKSTLLKILAGIAEPDKGEISIRNDVRVSYLPQEPDLDPNKNKFEEVLSSDLPIVRAVREYEESMEYPDDTDRMQKAYDNMVKFDAWEYESKVQEIFEKLELDKLNGQINTFSGGQKKRLALAKVLLDDADFLILDEPTNHIDVDMISWLEEYISQNDITLLLVTHDRYFLNKVCDSVIELHQGKIYKHKGNYEYYLEQRNIRLENQNTEIDKTKKLLKKELEWVKRQPQGRQNKSSARVDAYYETKSKLGRKYNDENISLNTKETRIGRKVLDLHNVSKSFGDKIILDNFEYEFNKGEKIGIVGKNGVGKTTFLNLIMGKLEPDSGKIVIGQTVSFGYYSQYQEDLNPNHRVIDSVQEIARNIKLPEGKEISASKMLEKFLFSPKEQQTKISKLSGGERKRVALLRILMKNPNFLILDEPTNDFDLMTLDVLEKFLQNFQGCLIIISHDRHFMDSIVDQVFAFEGQGQVTIFPGNYSEYRNSKIKKNDKSIKKTPTKQSEKDQKQANQLFREISKLESKRDKVKDKMFDAVTDFDKIAELQKEFDSLDAKINEMSDKWLELSA